MCGLLFLDYDYMAKIRSLQQQQQQQTKRVPSGFIDAVKKEKSKTAFNYLS